MLALRRDFLGYLTRATSRYGDVFSTRMGSIVVTVLNHPDLIRDVLVTRQRLFAKGRALEEARRILGNGLLTSEGEFHLRQRRLAQPAFHRERVAAYADTMVDYATRASDRWRNGMHVDMHAEMMRVTLGIVGKTLFDTDVEDDASEIGHALTDVLSLFDFVMLPMSRVIERLPLPFVRRTRAAKQTLDAVIYRIIRERRADPREHGDLLSMLMTATDDEDADDSAGMTDEQLRDEVMTLFLAGHETTANALAWTWYLLATHPEVLTRVQAELDRIDGPLTFASLPQLSYTRQVVTESIRLYPPAYAIGRRATAPYPFEWEGRHYTLPARSIVLVSPYLQHHDARWFADPERFDPDRWLPDAVASRPKFSYFPFGAGTRVCIGEQFAWTEAILVLATLARTWDVRPAGAAPPRLQSKITLRPRDGIPLTLARR